MLSYDRIDICEGIDINKTSVLKKCNICHYWNILEKRFKFQQHVFNRYHDILMMSINLNYIGILSINIADSCCLVNEICKSDALNLMQNANLKKKKYHRDKKSYKIFFTIYNICKEIITFGDIEV